jgi:catechol 2,3-dioxygenase-like lactoylglutathione lyase family enzyme
MGSPGSVPVPAEILIADMAAGESRVEFIQYLEPRSAPYPGNPSVAGSAHLALLTDDIENERARLEQAGVRFHTPIRAVEDSGKTPWRWCYFRDPDGICVELVQGGEPE